MRRGKTYRDAREKVDRDREYAPAESADLLCRLAELLRTRARVRNCLDVAADVATAAFWVFAADTVRVKVAEGLADAFENGLTRALDQPVEARSGRAAARAVATSAVAPFASSSRSASVP